MARIRDGLVSWALVTYASPEYEVHCLDSAGCLELWIPLGLGPSTLLSQPVPCFAARKPPYYSQYFLVSMLVPR